MRVRWKANDSGDVQATWSPDGAGDRELERSLSGCTIFLGVRLAAWSEHAEREMLCPVNTTKGQGGEEVGDTGKGQMGKMDPGFKVGE